MRTITYDLKQLLQEARRGAFAIPQFQRDFVWNQSQVRLLVDSVSRNYPIGSLLFLTETNAKDPFLHSRPVSALIRDPPDEDETGSTDLASRFYVLDGQQRLTSVLRVFLQGTQNKKYFFDLKQLMLHHSEETAQSSWVVMRGNNTKMTKKYLRSDLVMDAEKCQILVEEYFESEDSDLEGNRPEQRKASARVNRIFETIRNFQIPIVVIDQKEEGIESICRIFETINSTGTRLTTFDLAVARYFPNPDLASMWKKSKEDHPILGRYEVEGERALQTVQLLATLQTSTNPETTRSALLGIPRPTLSALWEEATAALAAAYHWAEERGATPGRIPHEGMLIPIAFVLARVTNEWKMKYSDYMTTLQRWYFAHSLQQGARQASNYQLGRAASAVKNWVFNGAALDPPEVVLSAPDLAKLREGDNRYRALLALLRLRAKKDLWTGEELRPELVEDHHIFPAAIGKRENIERKYLDSIANRILVVRATNRSLSDELPRDYMSKLWQGAISRQETAIKSEMLRAACLPVPTSMQDIQEIYDIKKFSEFLTC